jgi:hypothetical protein
MVLARVCQYAFDPIILIAAIRKVIKAPLSFLGAVKLSYIRHNFIFALDFRQQGFFEQLDTRLF